MSYLSRKVERKASCESEAGRLRQGALCRRRLRAWRVVARVSVGMG